MGIGAALALVAAACCSGAWLLRALRAEPVRPADAGLAALAVGNGLLGIAGLALAAAHALAPAVAWAVVLALAAPGLPALGRLVAAGWRARRRPTRTEALALAVLVPYLAAVLVMVLAPSVTGDQTKYQLAYPKLYAAAGGLVATPWTFWGQQQFLENFLYALAFSVGDEVTVHLVHAAMGLVAVAAAARLVERWLAPGWQWAMALLVATQPMTWSMLGANGADLPVVAYTVLAVAALLAWRGGEAGALRRAALLAGLAGGTKVLGLLTPALVGGAVLLHAYREGAGRAARVGVVFGGLAAAVAAGPYVRNAVEVGNPLHPFGQSVFHGANWSEEAGAYLGEYYRQYRAERAVRRGGRPYGGLDALRFPWDLTLYPESFERSARWALDVGPFMLATLPPALWLAAGAPAARVVVVVALLYGGVVAGGVWAHPRYVLPAVTLLGAAGLAALARLFPRRLVVGVVAVTVLGQLVVTARLAAATWPDELRVAVGATTRERFLAAHSDRYRFWRAVDAVVPPDGRVLVLGKIPHPYFIDRPFVLGSYLEQTLLDYRRMAGPADVVAAARQAGVGWVVFETEDLGRSADPYERHAVALWAALRAQLGPVLVREGARELYRLAPEPRS